MSKDFKIWNNKKELLHDDKDRPFFYEAEIWFCSFGVNIGFEQDGKGKDFLRPVLIIKKFNKEIFWGLPLTRTTKKNNYYFQFKLNDQMSAVILSQIRLIDAKRLEYKIGKIEIDNFEEIKKRLIRFLA